MKIKTSGRDDSRSDQYRYPYEPTPYSVLERLAGSGYIRKSNCLLDYGCGKGRVDFFLSYQTRCRSVGVEYDSRIYETVCENKRHAVSGSRTEFVMGNAENYVVPAEVDRVFFFNPFSVEILRKVLAKIEDSYYENPREIQLFFYYPSDEYLMCLSQEYNVTFVQEIDCSDISDGESRREKVVVYRVGEK